MRLILETWRYSFIHALFHGGLASLHLSFIINPTVVDGLAKSQGINSHGIALVLLAYRARVVMHVGALTRSGGENVPGIPAHVQPAIWRIW